MLSLTLSGFGADGLPVAVRLPKAHLAGGERLSAAPTNWRKLGSAPIRVRSTVHGRTSTRLVKGSRIGRSFAAVRGAKLDSDGTHVSLALRLKHAPKSAAVSPVVEVLQGRKVVAMSKPARFSGREMAKPSLALARRVRPAAITCCGCGFSRPSPTGSPRTRWWSGRSLKAAGGPLAFRLLER